MKFVVLQILAGQSIFFEHGNRRQEMCIYIVPRWIEGFRTYLVKRRLFPFPEEFKYGNVRLTLF